MMAPFTQELEPPAIPGRFNRLRSFRDKWYETVRDRRNVVATASGQMQMADEFSQVGLCWGYINHGRLIQTIPEGLIRKADQELFTRLRSSGVLDSRGILLKPEGAQLGDSYLSNTVYDYCGFHDGHALHVFYSDLVDLFSESISLTHLDESNWKKTFIKRAIEPGSFIFINRGQYFRKVREDVENAEIAVQTFKRKIKIAYQVNTRNMFGTSSITVSFSGRRSCASLLQVKSIEDQGADLVLHCTPIALGIGFHAKISDLLRDRPNYSVSCE